MDTDIIRIYHNLCSKYPIELTSAWKQGFQSGVDYPILTGTSSLGKFELYFDDVPSFAFYVTRHNGEFLTHWHKDTAIEAEKDIVDFMNGSITLISFGQPHDI